VILGHTPRFQDFNGHESRATWDTMSIV
jgi:hypothetical protein